MITRELLACKPQLKPQVSGRYYDSDVELADIVRLSSLEATPSLILEHQLLLLHALQVAPDLT